MGILIEIYFNLRNDCVIFLGRMEITCWSEEEDAVNRKFGWFWFNIHNYPDGSS